VPHLPVDSPSLELIWKREDTNPEFTVTNGRIKQSIMGWCFNDQFDSDKMANTLQLAKHCKEIGIVAMEGIPREAYPEVRKLGLEISLILSHGFAQGPCNPEFREQTIEKLHEGIQVAKESDCKSVITFTGMKFDGMDPAKAAQDCVDTWKEVVPAAEKAGVTLVLEHLNSRDDSHPMKGHPDYFGDDVDFCAELIQKVDSPNFKLVIRYLSCVGHERGCHSSDSAVSRNHRALSHSRKSRPCRIG